MSRNSTSKGSQTNWEYIDNLPDENIDLSDIPEVTETQMARATLRVGGQPDMESLLRRVIREELNTTAMHASAA